MRISYQLLLVIVTQLQLGLIARASPTPVTSNGEVVGEINIQLSFKTGDVFPLRYKIEVFDDVKNPSDQFIRFDPSVEESKRNWYKLTNLGSIETNTGQIRMDGKLTKFSVTPRIDSVEKKYYTNHLFYSIGYTYLIELESSELRDWNLSAVFDNQSLQKIIKKAPPKLDTNSRTIVVLLKDVKLIYGGLVSSPISDADRN